MKNPLHYFTLLCFALLMLSCLKEQVPERNLLPNATVEAQERCIDRCEDCPTMTHCCCEVRIIDAINSEVRFCGDFLGCGTFHPICNIDGTFTCPPINGIQLIDVINHPDTLFFCIPRDEAFIIRNYVGDISLEIECQQDSGPSVIIPIDLDQGEMATILLAGNCIPDQCN